MSRFTSMKKTWLYEKPSFPSLGRSGRSSNSEGQVSPVHSSPSSSGKKSRRGRPSLQPINTSIANSPDAHRKSSRPNSPIRESENVIEYAEGYTLSDHGDLQSPEVKSPFVSVATEAHILKRRWRDWRKVPKKTKDLQSGTSSANSSFSGLSEDPVPVDQKETMKPALKIDTNTNIDEVQFVSPLHRRLFTHPNQPIILNSLKDLVEVFGIRDGPSTPVTAVALPTEESNPDKTSKVVAREGSDSETDVENDDSDTETVVDTAPADVTKFKFDDVASTPAPPRSADKSAESSFSEEDSPTRAFKSLISFFNTSPRLRPPMPNKAKFINKTLKLGEYSRFKSLKTSPQRKAALASEFASFKPKNRTPKRKAIPEWA